MKQEGEEDESEEEKSGSEEEEEEEEEDDEEEEGEGKEKKEKVCCLSRFHKNFMKFADIDVKILTGICKLKSKSTLEFDDS